MELLVEGVPPHAWDRAVEEDLLGKSCAVEEVAEETASCRDMSIFKLRGWTSDLNSILVARTLVVPAAEVAAGFLVRSHGTRARPINMEAALGGAHGKWTKA
jgi:hypothetical protein